jgi:beta-mannosidase
VRSVFGDVPDTLREFSFASQAVQAEAFKFFVEWFRMGKWRRTGIIWWNLVDGWPQFSDAVVDYYFRKKLAFDVLKRAQQPVLLMLAEPEAGSQRILLCNDTPKPVSFAYSICDLESEEVVKSGFAEAGPDSVTAVSSLPVPHGYQTMYALEWTQGRSHYLLGEPPFNLGQYCGWLRRSVV